MFCPFLSCHDDRSFSACDEFPVKALEIGPCTGLLLQCCAVADWRQIQARIRKAKVGEDAPSKLTQLFDKTGDGMVAYELATLLEKNGRTEEAVRWYATAAERFRRADWKQKARDALTRLGGTPPGEPFEFAAQAQEPGPAPAEEVSEPARAEPPTPSAPAAEREGHRKRRRGRRGGRGRKRRGQTPEPAVAPVPSVARSAPPVREPEPPPPPRAEFRPVEREPEAAAPREASHPGFRAGDPALASRTAQLESRLRRLFASPAYSLDEAEDAPAGPGVYLLSDSDQVTHYYVEACQTLRIALGNLVKSGRAGTREASFSLRPGLAEHLGISEAKVKDYLRKHCVIRWVQLDEGASHLAHFAIAVLHPVLNE